MSGHPMSQPWLPAEVEKMICEYVEIHGDPFAPWESSTNLSTQEKAWKCNGCAAGGVSKWPDWKLELKHEPGCAWLAWKKYVEGLK